MEVFWIVIRVPKPSMSKKIPPSGSTPKNYTTLEAAQNQAKDAATACNDSTFVVMQAVGAYCIPDPIPPQPVSLLITERKHQPDPESDYDDADLFNEEE